jgi:hypothetical protein
MMMMTMMLNIKIMDDMILWLDRYQDSAAIEGHPQSILGVVLDESHVLDSSGRPPIVRNPVILTL